MELDRQLIRLAASPDDKEAAIRQVGQLLVDTGHIQPGYIESMLEREEVANTYLGKGISIPHGVPKDRDLINRTGISVAQVPDGVTWNPGETAHLIVGIAAKTDEHLDVLRRLTRVLGNQELVQELIHTDDPSDIIEALTGERPVAPEEEALPDFDQGFDIVVRNRTGLHARPATFFVQLAKEFDADIRVRHGEDVGVGKSLMSILQLGVESGARIHVSADGPDAEEALTALKQAIESGLGEGEEEEVPEPAAAPALDYSWVPEQVRLTVDGVPASPGLAVGPVRQYATQDLVVEDDPASPAVEGEKLQNALDEAKAELDELYEKVKSRLGADQASIFQAHAEFLDDAELVQKTVKLIYQGHSAAWAWQTIIDERVERLKNLDDPTLAGRAVDLRDVGQRVLRHILGVEGVSTVAVDHPFILVADDLTPSDTAALDPDAILGFCTTGGGPTSHTAIIARSMGIPAVVGADADAREISDDTLGIIDGYNGRLYVDPSEADVEEARSLKQSLQVEQDAARASRFEQAVTTDGHRVEVAANINRAKDIGQAVDAGAEGVGLMRTEFLFLERDAAPSEDEQYQVYREMVEALEGRPLIIRTLDIGGDKEIPYLNLPEEQNPFLGIRGIRLCLEYPELFKPQLRAIYRAAAHGPVQIMFPMVATLEDLQRARAVAEEVREALGAEPIPIGIMVEVPSAVVMADEFAREVDFFSIGTNDLTQYVLAMDRVHPKLAKQADALHPAVLRMVDATVRAAEQEGVWVGVCGGVAADPKGAVILTGLGVSELSVNVPSVPAVKAQIRTYSLEHMRDIAQRALECRTAREVRELV